MRKLILLFGLALCGCQTTSIKGNVYLVQTCNLKNDQHCSDCLYEKEVNSDWRYIDTGKMFVFPDSEGHHWHCIYYFKG